VTRWSRGQRYYSRDGREQHGPGERVSTRRLVSSTSRSVFNGDFSRKRELDLESRETASARGRSRSLPASTSEGGLVSMCGCQNATQLIAARRTTSLQGLGDSLASSRSSWSEPRRPNRLRQDRYIYVQPSSRDFAIPSEWRIHGSDVRTVLPGQFRHRCRHR